MVDLLGARGFLYTKGLLLAIVTFFPSVIFSLCNCTNYVLYPCVRPGVGKIIKFDEKF